RYGDLSTNKHNVQELRTPATASRSGFARDHDHMISLGIQRAGFGTGFGFHSVFDHEFSGAFFLDDAQRAVAVRTKSLHGGWIEDCPVAGSGDVVVGDVFALDSRAVSTTGAASPPAATNGEKTLFIGIEGEARRPVTLLTEVEMAGHLEGFGVHHGDVV